MVDYKVAVARVMTNLRYLKNIEFGEPRSGHPEGKVKYHIADLEVNLERLKLRLPNEDTYWKLKFLIHVHDTLKAEVDQESIRKNSPGHAILAREFAREFTDEIDILNIIQYHDEDFALWKQLQSTGYYDTQRFDMLLNTIQDWDLFLSFMIIDGSTEGKILEKLSWFINLVRQHKTIQVDEMWVQGGFGNRKYCSCKSVWHDC